MRVTQLKVKRLIETLADWADQSPFLGMRRLGDGVELPGIPSVYLLCDADDKILYVGQSNQIRARAAQHSANPKIAGSGWDRTYFFEPGIGGHHLRLAVETALIGCLVPRLNTAILLRVGLGGTLSEIRWSRKRHGGRAGLA